MTDESPEDLAARRRNTAISLLEDAKDEAILGTFSEVLIIGSNPTELIQQLLLHPWTETGSGVR